jgi:hypothetical protein
VRSKLCVLMKLVWNIPTVFRRSKKKLQIMFPFSSCSKGLLNLVVSAAALCNSDHVILTLQHLIYLSVLKEHIRINIIYNKCYQKGHLRDSICIHTSKEKCHGRNVHQFLFNPTIHYQWSFQKAHSSNDVREIKEIILRIIYNA